MDSMLKGLFSGGASRSSTATTPATSKATAVAVATTPTTSEGTNANKRSYAAMKGGDAKTPIDVDSDTTAASAATTASSVIAGSTTTSTTTSAKKPAACFAFSRANGADSNPVTSESTNNTTTFPVPDANLWTFISRQLPRCAPAEGIRETSYFASHPSAAATTAASTTSCLRRLLQELVTLDANLPQTMPQIYVRFDEEHPQFMRAIITAPHGTPYAFGVFCFDLHIPNSYPLVPPKMQLLTTGNGSVGFSPNLYVDGKVCLSLLGTWQGPKWNPQESTLLQVLMSVQGLILGVEHPYYLEPGHGGWEGKKLPPKSVPHNVQQFEDKIRTGTVEFAMLDVLSSIHITTANNDTDTDTATTTITTTSTGTGRYLKPFADVLHCHFYHCQHSILATAKVFATTILLASFRRRVTEAAKQLQDSLQALPKPNIIEQAEQEALLANTSNTTANNNDDAKKPPSLSVVESVIATKRQALQDAVAKEDYVTAGRLQTELQHLQGQANSSVTGLMAAKKQAMEEAAQKGDYITAGQFQAALQHLETNSPLLTRLEHNMYQAAARLEFVKAGRFQEQYQILLQQSTGDTGTTTTTAATASGGSGTAATATATTHRGNPLTPAALMAMMPPSNMMPPGVFPAGAGGGGKLGYPPMSAAVAAALSKSAPPEYYEDPYHYEDDDDSYGDY